MKKTDWIQTYTKKKFYPLEPEIENICIEDIAHSLAMQCRFVGHTKFFYSVAQHSVLLVSRYFSGNTDLSRYALLHDAAEAYLSDLPRPLKYLPEFGFYRAAETRLQKMIYEHFGLEPEEPDEVKYADKEILKEEAMSESVMFPLHPDWKDRNEIPIFEIEPWQPDYAEFQFLRVFDRLFKQAS